MYIRYDRVIRHDYDDTPLVYSLVLDEHGIFVLRTGAAVGLVSARAQGEGDSQRAIDEIRRNEERLVSLPLHHLAKEADSAFVPYDRVLSVVARCRADERAMFLKTETTRFSFRFPYATAEQVRELLQTITERT